MFIVAGIGSGVPLIHIALFEVKGTLEVDITPWVIGGALYIGGALIYIARIPEKFF